MNEVLSFTSKGKHLEIIGFVVEPEVLCYDVPQIVQVIIRHNGQLKCVNNSESFLQLLVSASQVFESPVTFKDPKNWQINSRIKDPSKWTVTRDGIVHPLTSFMQWYPKDRNNTVDSLVLEQYVKKADFLGFMSKPIEQVLECLWMENNVEDLPWALFAVQDNGSEEPPMLPLIFGHGTVSAVSALSYMENWIPEYGEPQLSIIYASRTEILKDGYIRAGFDDQSISFSPSIILPKGQFLNSKENQQIFEVVDAFYSRWYAENFQEGTEKLAVVDITEQFSAQLLEDFLSSKKSY